jgi:hypothetical protein
MRLTNAMAMPIPAFAPLESRVDLGFTVASDDGVGETPDGVDAAINIAELDEEDRVEGDIIMDDEVEAAS